ncbi:MAG: hypothetical protein SGPRY_005374 [Prymnesium sp.]
MAANEASLPPSAARLLGGAAMWLLPSALLIWLARSTPSPPPLPSPPLCRTPSADAAEDSEEEEAVKSEHEIEIWRRVDGVFDEYSLSPLVRVAAKKWMRMMADPANVDLERLRDWMLMKVNGKARSAPLTSWQSGCPEILPGLRAMPVWPREEATWLQPFEDQFDSIRKEVLALRSEKGFQPLKIPNWASKNTVASPDGAGSVSHDTGDWNVYYLFLHEVKFPENCARCPATIKLLEQLGVRSYQHAFFSALTPGTHIIKHHGPTNKKLRVHLPILGAEGSKLRVADQFLHGKEGECMIIDDSFEHEAWHHGEKTRIVLVFDVWHPDLKDREIQFLSMLQRSRMRAEMAAERRVREDSKCLNDDTTKVGKDKCHALQLVPRKHDERGCRISRLPRLDLCILHECAG